MTKNLVIDGMHGLGDNIHQRAYLKQLIPDYNVYLKTSWASVYHDLIPLGLKIIRAPTRLRTQLKNQNREAHLFSAKDLPRSEIEHFRIMYHGHNIEATKSKTVLEAMGLTFGHGTTYAAADYSLPIPDAWKLPAQRLLAGVEKPILIYRPLTVRPEWRGNEKRNPLPSVYTELFASIRDRFYVVSVADLEPDREWLIGPRLKADKELHNGELPFEYLAGLFSLADLVFAPGGFGVILAPAVGTPCISIVGGYERAQWHSSGSLFAPWLGIEPIKPCVCSIANCPQACKKETNMTDAFKKIKDFTDGLDLSTNVEKPRIAEKAPVVEKKPVVAAPVVVEKKPVAAPAPVAEVFTPEPTPVVPLAHRQLMMAMYPKRRKI